jgi:hypothetical protein
MASPSPASPTERLLAYLRSAAGHPALAAAPPPVTLEALAARTGLLVPDLRHALDRLVAAGTVEVQVHDRGLVHVRLLDPSEQDPASRIA